MGCVPPNYGNGASLPPQVCQQNPNQPGCQPNYGQPNYGPPQGYPPPGGYPQPGPQPSYPRTGGPDYPGRLPYPYPAPGPYPQQQSPGSFLLPSATPVPAPSASAAAPPPPTVVTTLSQEKQNCLGENGSDEDCTAALKQLADGNASGSENEAVLVYEKACAKKAKLLGCGAFKSQAVTAEDRPTIGLLGLCEFGRYEACEDVATKAPPLKAWLINLKESGCKKGATALCKNYKACKAKTDWGCKPAGSGSEVCGCVPQCSGTLSVTAGTRSWPDGSKRGVFACEP